MDILNQVIEDLKSQYRIEIEKAQAILEDPWSSSDALFQANRRLIFWTGKFKTLAEIKSKYQEISRGK